VATELETKTTFNIVGSETARHDAYEKAAGAAVFGTDFSLPNMLFGKIVWSKRAHARIIKIDVSRVAEIAGVRAIITANDMPPVSYGIVLQDQTVLARQKVVYRGQPVAAVAADSLELAERAVEQIQIYYEELPVILDPELAMEPSSTQIHEDILPLGSPDPKLRNVASYTRIQRGSIEHGLKEADLVLEEDYKTQMVHQSYIEPRAATAAVDPQGKLKVWTSTQSPFSIRAGLAQVLQMPINKIEVIGTYTGGGFGGKIGISIEPICAVLAMKTKRPVKIILTREEEFAYGTPRPSIRYQIKSGVRKDGVITCRIAKAIVDSGAFASEGAIYANIAAIQLNGPYKIQNILLEAYSVYTNKQPAGSFRAPGSAETAFAVESHTDSLAKSIGMDPVEFRLKNAWNERSIGPTGQIMHNVGLKEAINKVAQMIKWKSDKTPNRGYGIACGLIPSVGIHSSGAIVKLNDDGTVLVITGVPDTGSGAVTGLKMIAAEELTIPLSAVAILNADTDLAPWDGGTQGSRTTYCAGSAVMRAARDARSQVFAVAAHMLKVKGESLALEDGKVVTRDGKVSIPLAQVATYSYYTFGGPIVGRGSFVLDWPQYDKNALDGFHLVPSFHDPTYCAHAALVEVNPVTGKVTIIRYAVAQDVGFAVNPSGIEGQMQGGVVQGIGYALTESVNHDEFGNILNANFAEYKLPTIADVPFTIETSIIEGFFGSGPYGAKGVGEANIVPPAGAIANAIYDAVGVRVNNLPITPDKISDLIFQQQLH
jgi:CO/xanthine dehydrogenase Mo-binding subunit